MRLGLVGTGVPRGLLACNRHTHISVHVHVTVSIVACRFLYVTANDLPQKTGLNDTRKYGVHTLSWQTSLESRGFRT